MKHTVEGNGVGQYAAVGVQTGVTAASPHQLIQMLLDGAIGKIAAAKGAMQRGQIEQKGDHISSASSVILGLRGSLDLETGGEIARNLDELYGYMVRRLMEAHGDNDLSALDEVTDLLRQIKRGWEAIMEQVTKNAPEVRGAAGT